MGIDPEPDPSAAPTSEPGTVFHLIGSDDRAQTSGETAAYTNKGSADRECNSEVQVPGYEILGRLGRGGMGVVYKARDLRLHRIVALKMIRSGDQASREEAARFQTEAQAAARVQHPNVVQIFEVGTADGQPYLCLEYVDGDSLANRLNGTPWRDPDAARLIETLARAMDAAHKQGVVHRDLKPSNILLQKDEGGRMKDEKTPRLGSDSSFILHNSAFLPKITDFGLAKLLESSQGQTQSGAFLGTPSYASPEQAGGGKKSVGPHTDVYALGAILYELLTGRPPFKGATLLETIHQVVHQEPVPPRLLNSAIAPDLEVICLKCLEKSPARRYENAAALADDLRRWQNNEPILARPPGSLGRAVRWCRRHPALAALACIFVLAATGVTWQWREAVAAGELAEIRRKDAVEASKLAELRRQEADKATKQAEEEATAAREISRFLAGVFEDTDVLGLSGRTFGDLPKVNPTAVDILDRGARKLAQKDTLRDKPLVRATLLDKVGNAYASLGHANKAAPLLVEALDLRRAHLPADHADLGDSLHSLGFLELTKGSVKKSSDLLAAAVAIRTKHFGPKGTPTLTSKFFLGFAQSMIDHDNQARTILAETAQAQRERLKEMAISSPELLGGESFALCVTLLVLTQAHIAHDDLLQAAALAVEIKQIARSIPNKDWGAVVEHIVNSKQWQALGQHDLAEKDLRRAVNYIEKTVGKGHYFGSLIEKEHATLLFELKRYDEAEEAFLRLEKDYKKTFGEEGRGLANVYWTLARIVERGRLDKALSGKSSEAPATLRATIEKYARAAVTTDRRNSAEPREFAFHAVYCAHVLMHVRTPPDYVEAEVLTRESWLLRKKAYGPGNMMTLHPFGLLLHTLAAQKKFDETERLFAELLQEAKQPKWKGDPADTLPDVAGLLAVAGRGKTAVGLLEHATIAGFRDVTMLRTDPAFAPLRERDDFKSLMKRLERQK